MPYSETSASRRIIPATNELHGVQHSQLRFKIYHHTHLMVNKILCMLKRVKTNLKQLFIV